MFKKFKSVALTSVLFVFGFAYNASATPINTSANIVGNITVTETTPLSFGDITSGTTAGTVTLTTGGAISASNATIVLLGSEQVGDMALNTTGVPVASTITVTVTGGTLTSGLNTMTVLGNCEGPGGAASAINAPCTFTVTPGPAESVLIGGELSVGANQATGNYTGTMEVTAAF